MNDQQPIRVVLDSTAAITAYCRGSVDVGEIIGEVGDEGAVAALPVVCLVDARAEIADSDLLDLLVAHHHTTVLGLDPADWRALTAAHDIVGRYDPASAVLASDDNDGAIILTTEPARYGGLAGGGPVVLIAPS